jgi:hypothetical protein
MVKRISKLQRSKTKQKLISFRFFVGFLGIVLLVSSLFYLYNYFKPLETRTLDVHFIIGNTPGFDVNSSALVFGRIPPKGSSSRKVVIQNTYEFPIKVSIFVSRDLSSYFIFEDIHYIEPGMAKDIWFNVAIPNNASEGEFRGKALFKITRE